MTNKDQVEGRSKELGGKIQEEFGKLTRNRGQQIKGTIRKSIGAGQAKLGDLEQREKERTKERETVQKDEREEDEAESHDRR